MTEITLKPDWDKAPEWARWWAVDETGAHYWFENKPILSRSGSMWIREDDDTGKLLVAYDGDWKESLQERPRKIAEPNTSKSQQLPFIVPPAPDFTRSDTPLLIACSDKYLNDLLVTVKRIEKILCPLHPTASIETKLDRIIELLELGQVVYIDSTQRIEDLLKKEQEADIDDLLTLAGIRPPEM